MTIHKVFKAAAQELGPRQVRVRCSSADVDRSGEIVVQSGIKFADSIPVLFQHDPALIVGRAKPLFIGLDLFADIDFAPEGISGKADEICGLAKHGVIDTVSIGFDPIDSEPMDPKKPRGAQKYLSCELLELSFVSVPANPKAEVVQRAKGAAESQEKDAMPQVVTKEARAAAVSKMHENLLKKGLWEIGYFAELLGCLGWLRDNAAWEAMLEGEPSQVAELIAEALRAAADAFLAMTAEEVAELLGDDDEDDVVDVLDTMDAGTAEVVMSGKTIAVRKFRAACALAKRRFNSVKKAAGPLDPSHTKCLKAALVQHQAGISHCKDGIAAHKKAMKSISAMLDDSDNSDTQSGATDEEDDGDEEKAAEAARLKAAGEADQADQAAQADRKKKYLELAGISPAA